MNYTQSQGRKINFIALKQKDNKEGWNPGEKVDYTSVAKHPECCFV
jgi:hypothetical protein